MKILNIHAGSPEWHIHRGAHRNGSDSAIVMGISPYKTRSKFMFEKFTGIIDDISTYQQYLFDKGHQFEALARARAEAIIGESLSPVVGVNNVFSASFDGITFLGEITWEHKTLNDELRKVLVADHIPKHIRLQIEHGLMVSDADKCLFHASSWDDSDKFLEEVSCWVYPDLILRREIIAAWDQFDKDYVNYSPPESVVKPQAETIMQLPSVVINVRGELSLCNLNEVMPKFDAFLSSAKTQLTTDDDFATGEAMAKFSRAAAKTLKAKAKEVIDQISTVSEAVRTLEYYAEKFDKLGLTLEKAVKEQKDAIKVALLQQATAEFKLHVAELEAETHPIKLTVEQPKFADVMKNQRLLDTLRDKVAGELARVKILSDEVAKDIRRKLEFMKTVADYNFLFSDLQQIISMPMSYFTVMVSDRIFQHKKTEEIKEATLRKKIQQQAVEQAVKTASEAEFRSQAVTPGEAVLADVKSRIGIAETVEADVTNHPSVRPSNHEIITVLACHYRVSLDVVDGWLMEIYGV